MRRMAGWFLHLCYKLESHYVSQISIKNWIWAWVVVPWGVALFRRLSWWYAIPLSLAGLLLWTGIMVTRRKGDLLFEPAPLAQNQIVYKIMAQTGYHLSVSGQKTPPRRGLEQVSPASEKKYIHLPPLGATQTLASSDAIRRSTSRLFCTSSAVVAQQDTLILIATCPCHSVPPNQHVPSWCTR
jgi:hypothetical protein